MAHICINILQLFDKNDLELFRDSDKHEQLSDIHISEESMVVSFDTKWSPEERYIEDLLSGDYILDYEELGSYCYGRTIRKDGAIKQYFLTEEEIKSVDRNYDDWQEDLEAVLDAKIKADGPPKHTKKVYYLVGEWACRIMSDEEDLEKIAKKIDSHEADIFSFDPMEDDIEAFMECMRGWHYWAQISEEDVNKINELITIA